MLTWNLFHGRDFPPEAGLRTRRSRLSGRTERGAAYAHVNASLLEHFTAVLASEPWHLALLQEAPPPWLAPLCRALGAHGALALTARNAGAPLRRRLAEWRPDLLGAWEGGSNQILVRPPWRLAEVDRLVLSRRPERRRLLWGRLEGPGGRLGVGCLHLTVRRPEQAAAEALRAAAWARAASGADPLLLGGDFNLRADHVPAPFRALEERYGLTPATPGAAIDHLLGAGLTPVEAPHALAPERREVAGPGGLRLRLSDHAPVVAAYEWPPRAAASAGSGDGSTSS